MPPRHTFRLSAVLLAITAAISPGGSFAASPPSEMPLAAVKTYNIAPADLTSMLQTISRDSGYHIEFSPDEVTGIRGGVVTGKLTVTQAVTQALSGTGLSVNEEQNGVLQVSRTTTLDSITVVARRDQAEDNFKADRSDTATRSGTSLMEVPSSVTILTSKVLESQQTRSVQDALSNVSGVSFDESPQGKPTLSIRGFPDTTAMVNGISDSSAALTNVFNVERIEVLKGPQAILAGADSLGGGVNIVTKKPQAEALHSVTVQYGTDDEKTISGDFTGALTSDNRLSYRLIASKTDVRKSPAGYHGREDQSVMPELRWMDEKTDLIVGYSYGKQHDPLQKYTFARNGIIQPVPSMLLGNRNDGYDTEQNRTFYQLEQNLTPSITLISRLQKADTDFKLHVWNPGVISDDGDVDYYASRSRYKTTETSGDHYLRIEGDTGPVSHKLSVGINHSNYTSDEMSYDGWNGTSDDAWVPGISIYPPDHFAFPEVNSSAQNLSMKYHSTAKQVGAYAQDLLTWGDWNLLLNLRRTKYTTASTSTFYADGIADTYSDGQKKDWSTTPGMGLIYSVTPEVSVYASYAEGFSPQFEQRCGGGLTDPQRSRNREVGAKFDLLDSKLSVTTAAFELKRSNVLSYNTLGSCYDTQAGQISRGLELDIQGELSPGWLAVMNYTYSHYKDDSDPDRIFTNAPEHKLSLWTTYEIQHDVFRGLGIGMGVNAFSHTNGDRREEYAFNVPGAAQVDMSIFYNRNQWSTTLGMKNIFDKNIYDASTANFVHVRDGRTILLTTKYSF